MNNQQATALFVSAFFDELARWGVCETVISPGSRSTALAMTAFEMSRRFPDRMRVYVDVDERGASFFALGLAKASGRPVALVCTSGTALANYYPAVLEAETSRVPLVVLSGDRPLRLQGLGAPQTVDQVKAYGDHVRCFRQMPLPAAGPADLAFARQAAREACLAAFGPGADAPGRGGEGEAVASRGCRYLAGPVQVNFQLDEPLTPDLSVEGLFEAGRGPLAQETSEALDAAPCVSDAGAIMAVRQRLDAQAVRQLYALMRGRRTLVLAGEGTCETAAEAREIVAWARRCSVPLLADPLSGLRSFADDLVVDNYDNVFGDEACPLPDVVVRFGRYPVSKRCTQRLAAARPVNVVVDVAQTRDFNLATDLFVACTPLAFVRSMAEAVTLDECADGLREHLHGGMRESFEKGFPQSNVDDLPDEIQRAFAQEWMALNDRARVRICAVDGGGQEPRGACDGEQAVEGAYVRALLEMAPEGSCVFSANSLSVRALDTFYVKQDKRLAVLCNRGQNGIDGTVSTALGAAQHFAQTTLVTGDLTLLHDLNALALQRELRLQREAAACFSASLDAASSKAAGAVTPGHATDAASDNVAPGAVPSIVIVLLNNNGGGIFDMLPQKSEDPYFERLFLTPQDVDFRAAAQAFGVPYRRADTVPAFDEAYRALLGTPGISLVEVRVPLSGLKDRYAPYW